MGERDDNELETEPQAMGSTRRRDAIIFLKGQFTHAQKGDINDFYSIDWTQLSKDGSLAHATYTSTGQVRGVKKVAKARALQKQFKDEVEATKAIDHPNVARLMEVFEDDDFVFVVTELCNGMNLKDSLKVHKMFSEENCAVIMKQIFRAVYYMHDKASVCHRDLKLENFYFSYNSDAVEKNLLKLTGFYNCCRIVKGTPLTGRSGTLRYMSPQMLQGKYDKCTDMWSLGVIMHVLLSAVFPFNGKNDAGIEASIIEGKISYSKEVWINISDECKLLLSKLLEMNPRMRHTDEKAVEDPWILDRVPKAKIAQIQGSMLTNLQDFNGHCCLKKAAIHIIAGQLNDSQTEQLREVFNGMDDNGDGMLSMVEIKECLVKTALKDILPTLQNCLEELDTDGNGGVDYTEFLAATLDKKLFIQEDLCWAAFRVFDQDGDGSIDTGEVARILLNGELDGKVAGALMGELDKNGDGKIDFAEFMDMMRTDVLARQLFLTGRNMRDELEDEERANPGGGPIRRRVLQMLQFTRVASALRMTRRLLPTGGTSAVVRSLSHSAKLVGKILPKRQRRLSSG